jgi:hypothetical protein
MSWLLTRIVAKPHKLPSIQPVLEPNRSAPNNTQFSTFTSFGQPAANFNTPPLSNFQYAPTPPQPPEPGQNSHQEQTTAKLLIGKPEYAPSDLDSNVSGVDEDYFDLDIETYYSKGNNACGFIPGLPVILTDNNVPETDDDFLTSDFASVSGRSSVYDR